MPSTSTKRSHKHSSSSSKSKKSKKRDYISTDSDADSTDKQDFSDDEAEGEWVVEKVVGKRLRGGKTEYFIKWKDWPSSTNTWEPVSNLTNCPQLVEQYEESIKPGKKKSVDAGPNGFDKGWKAVAVRGVAPFDFSTSKEVFYLIEWEDNEALEKIPSRIVRDKIPQHLIRYLEGKIRWKTRISNPDAVQETRDRKSEKKETIDISKNRKDSATDHSRKSSHNLDDDSSGDEKKSAKSYRRNGNADSGKSNPSSSSSGTDSS